jgi:hypothetical protein
MGRRIETMKQYPLPTALFLFSITSLGFMMLSSPLVAQLSRDSLQALTEKKESLSTFERSFTPSFYDNEVYLFKKGDTARMYGTSINQQTIALPETLQGYRVQVLATNNYDDALSMKNTLNAAYPELWVYTVYESPSYKIRVGDFLNRYDAKSLLDSLQMNGYKNAWIVPDKVVHNQPPKPPLPIPIDSTSFGESDEK